MSRSRFCNQPSSSTPESITDEAHDEGIAAADDLKDEKEDLDKTEGHRADRNQEQYKIAGVRGGRQRDPQAAVA